MPRLGAVTPWADRSRDQAAVRTSGRARAVALAHLPGWFDSPRAAAQRRRIEARSGHSASVQRQPDDLMAAPGARIADADMPTMGLGEGERGQAQYTTHVTPETAGLGPATAAAGLLASGAGLVTSGVKVHDARQLSAADRAALAKIVAAKMAS